MRDLTSQEQGDLVAHLTYVVQKVERYAEAQGTLNVTARIQAGYHMATAVEDAKEFLASLHLPPQPENLWQRLLSAFQPRRTRPQNSQPSPAPSSNPPQTPSLML